MRNHWLSKRWKLEMAFVPAQADSIRGGRIRISKGPYFSMLDADLSGLKDIFNMDASIEMTEIIISNIEYYPYHVRHYNLYEHKAVALTAKEKVKILKLVRGLRNGEEIDKLI
jgi:hypothetical protein